MKKILIHPLSSVLSAYGMGLADIIEIDSKSIEQPFTKTIFSTLEQHFTSLEEHCIRSLKKQGIPNQDLTKIRRVHIRYSGTNTEFPIDSDGYEQMLNKFKEVHRQRFGFVMKMRKLMVGTISVEVTSKGETITESAYPISNNLTPPQSIFTKEIYLDHHYQKVNFYDRNDLVPGHFLNGPCIIIEKNSTVLLRPHWQAEITDRNHLLITQTESKNVHQFKSVNTADPILLEIFNNLFMSIAEQMGEVLANVAYSVNIKERLDFSCALFDSQANLIANAPHIPVHLGSMGDSVRSVIQKWEQDIHPGDTFILNDPYDGGTHLPDITLVTPVFVEGKITFYVASRGHHADIGGMTPGSMPANSKHIDEEGVLIPNFKMVEN